MFSGNEWVILVAVAVVVAVLVLLVVRAVRGSAAKPKLYRARVRGESAEVVRDIQLALSGVRNTVAHRSEGTLTAAWSYVPNRAILCAVLFFPIGLIALIARTTVTGTVVTRDAADGTTELTMAGQFNGVAIAAINSVIDARS
jgi:uncharacterized membrane protein